MYVSLLSPCKCFFSSWFRESSVHLSPCRAHSLHAHILHNWHVCQRAHPVQCHQLHVADLTSLRGCPHEPVPLGAASSPWATLRQAGTWSSQETEPLTAAAAGGSCCAPYPPALSPRPETLLLLEGCRRRELQTMVFQVLIDWGLLPSPRLGIWVLDVGGSAYAMWVFFQCAVWVL